MLKLLIILAIAVTPFAASYRLDGDEVDYRLEKDDRFSSNNSTISLKQFNVLQLLGSGTYGFVYVAQKIGGPDDGKLYALKAGNITHILTKEKEHERDFIRHEREILEALRGSPMMIGLQYAWHEGKWIFLVTDLVVGEPLLYRYEYMSGDNDAHKSTKLVLAEIVVAFEILHSLQIRHNDFSFLNLLVDGDGHLVLIDFGWSERFVDTAKDWVRIARSFSRIFPRSINDQNGVSLIKMMNEMTDAQLPELKRHPYFDGINWENIAERKFDPPCTPYEFELELGEPMNLTESLNINTDEKLDADLANRLRNYTFVAPEHQFCE